MPKRNFYDNNFPGPRAPYWTKNDNKNTTNNQEEGKPHQWKSDNNLYKSKNCLPSPSTQEEEEEEEEFKNHVNCELNLVQPKSKLYSKYKIYVLLCEWKAQE